MESIVAIVILAIITTTIAILEVKIKNPQAAISKKNINEDSYQRYAKFYEQFIPTDIQFENKISIICKEILVEKNRNLKDLAERAGCTYDECILKIKYLQNKRIVPNFYIEHIEGRLLDCTKEDITLLKKYKPYIYKNHLTISEIASRLPGANLKNLEQLKKQVYDELKKLDEKNLINGIKFNEVDKEILYYTIEKRKQDKDIISIRCENCGAINDVNRRSKTRCSYCNTIVEDKTSE